MVPGKARHLAVQLPHKGRGDRSQIQSVGDLFKHPRPLKVAKGKVQARRPIGGHHRRRARVGWAHDKGKPRSHWCVVRPRPIKLVVHPSQQGLEAELWAGGFLLENGSRSGL